MAWAERTKNLSPVKIMEIFGKTWHYRDKLYT